MCIPDKTERSRRNAPQPMQPSPAEPEAEKAECPEEQVQPQQQKSREASKESAKSGKSGKSGKSTKSFKVDRGNTEAIKKGEVWLTAVLNKGVPKTMEEFRALAKWKPEKMTTEACMANKEKNRYLDVPCQDERRIVLKFPGIDSDFIHANYVGTASNEKRFICTQGPLENTQQSFWAMIVQEKVEVILMLCNVIECGKHKCFQYYPCQEGESMKIGEKDGEITVLNNGVKPLSEKEPTIRVCKLKVTWKDGECDVTHYQWENWPDRGVPPTTTTALKLIAAVRDNKNPICVHCSAGIGRTGTIVAIAYVQERMQNGESCMQMDELLKQIRSQRPFSIQNEMQYIYLHRVLLVYLIEKHKERYGKLLANPEMKAKYDEWCEAYQKATNFG